jgi:ketosteroid isomerase-like protein
MRRILVIAALCLCAAPAAAQQPTPAQPTTPAQPMNPAQPTPAQPSTRDAKQADRDRKEREKQQAKEPAGEKVGMAGKAEQELTQLTDQYIAALKGKDAAALERIWADDLTFITPGGAVLTKPQRLADNQPGATRFDWHEASDRTVRVYGDTAVMTSLTTMKGQYGGQEASGQYRVTNVFAKRGGGWQIVSLQMTPIVTPPAEKKP